jgi:enamine deaminase RidA (YjgF/YER057c/UK114 family)
MSVAEKLAELGLAIPKRRSAGQYVGAVRAGELMFISGAGPMVLNGLAAVQEELGDLELVSRIVKLLGFVNSAPGFTEQHVVMDGASNLLLSLFGERGRHARSSVGMAELPMNIAVEVEMIIQAS